MPRCRLGVGLTRLYASRNLKLRVGTNAGILQTEESIGGQSLKDFVAANRIPKFETAAKLSAEFGIGWTNEFLTQVGELKRNDLKDIRDILERVTFSQLFALIATFGLRASAQGPLITFQEFSKKQSLQQALMLMIVRLGRVGKLLEIVELLDALMAAGFTTKDRKGSRLFQPQAIELHLIMQTSDSQLYQDNKGLKPLAVRAYLMNVLPYALAQAFLAYVTLDHGY